MQAGSGGGLAAAARCPCAPHGWGGRGTDMDWGRPGDRRALSLSAGGRRACPAGGTGGRLRRGLALPRARWVRGTRHH